MSTLALDPATHFGWAISPEMFGTWDLSVKRDESAGMKLLRLEGKLNEMEASLRASDPIKLVVYEAARNAAPHMQGSLVHAAKLQAIVERWCMCKKIEYKGYSPKEIKKFATGKGNANKEAMLSGARKRWPNVNIEDDNQADALWILALATRDFAFLGEAMNGDVIPAEVIPKKKPRSEVPGKVIRAFRRAGRDGAPIEEKMLFYNRLKEADIVPSKKSSAFLAKLLTGELSFKA